MTLNASGNLSIGNTNDTYKLDVNGTGRFVNQLRAYNLLSDNQIKGSAYVELSPDQGTYNAWNIRLGAQAADACYYITGGGVNILTTEGYNNPYTVKLYSNGVQTLTMTNGAATFSSSVTAATLIFKDAINSNSYGFRGLSGIVTLDAGSVYPTGWNFQFGGGASSALYINGNGNVGIGNTGTNAKLEVTASTGEVFRADAASGAYRIIANQTQVLLNGNVGIGTTSPAATLDVRGTMRSEVSSNPTNAILFQLTNQTTSSPNGCKIAFDVYNVGAAAIGMPSNSADLAFYTNGNSTERMRITSGGTVLIGTTTEEFAGGKLQVAGAIRAAGQFTSVLSSSSFAYFDGSGQVVSSASSASALYLDTTWNTTGNPDGIYLNVTNTASGSSSKLLNLKVDNASQFSVSKGGAIQTSDPTNGTARPWKLGDARSGGISTDSYIIVSVNGVTYSIPALNGLP
jgi:hypothetical protein